jgi:hypothetical protein
MVLVTNKQYYLDPKLKEKLDLMIKRMEVGKDNLLLVDGDEGDGKTNISMGVGYYVAYTCNRPFSLENIFFDLDKLIDFAIKTKEQVIIWDEGALGGLASEWWNKNQKKFIKLLMIARKRQHFWIVNIPKFFKLNEYFVIDRSIGLLHVYMRGGLEHGKFVYFNQTQKEKLWEDWRRTHIRSYKKFWSFHGTFVMFLESKGDRFEDVISDVGYNKKKDEAILSIDKSEEKEKTLTPQQRELESNIRIINILEKMGLKRSEQAQQMGISEKRLEHIITYRNKVQSGITRTPLPLLI